MNLEAEFNTLWDPWINDEAPIKVILPIAANASSTPLVPMPIVLPNVVLPNAANASNMPPAPMPRVLMRPLRAKIDSAYAKKWILTNVHHPYPSPQMKTLLMRQCGITRQQLDTFLTNYRKRNKDKLNVSPESTH